MAQEIIEAGKLYEAVEQSFRRMSRYRRATAMFVRAYAGHYYANVHEYSAISGLTGEEPVNLIFNAIRILVPNTIMDNPQFDITTTVASQKDYAQLLSLATSQDAVKMNLKQVIREWLVDAYFGFGIVKTGLRSSGQFLTIDDKQIDPGQLYTTRVDLDNFVFDPYCNEPLFRDATFTGDVVTVPRQSLLDVDEYDKDLIMKLPSIQANPQKIDTTAEITGQAKYGNEFAAVRDLVRVIQLWVPEANARIIMPDPRVTTANGFIGQVEYFGPNEGPYDYLTLTQPVPGNPLPVAPASIWYDLHVATNKIFRKMLDQAERQKDILLFHPAHADEAVEITEAADGEVIASADPSKFNMVSFGGANVQNESMVSQLQTWFNYVAGNVDSMGGNKQSKGGTATAAQIQESNQTVTLQDARDIVHDGTGSLGKKYAWYKDTDPLLDNALSTRNDKGQTVYITLTPEQRSGDFDSISGVALQCLPLSRRCLPPWRRRIPGVASEPNC